MKGAILLVAWSLVACSGEASPVSPESASDRAAAPELAPAKTAPVARASPVSPVVPELPEVEALAEQAYAHFGEVNLLMNNAGVSHLPAALDEISEADFEAFRVLRTNLDFVRMEREAKTIMVTSAAPQEAWLALRGDPHVPLLERGQPVALVLLGVSLAADPEHPDVEQADRARQDTPVLRAAHRRVPDGQGAAGQHGGGGGRGPAPRVPRGRAVRALPR